MALDDAIIIPVVTQIDEARSVRSTESYAKKASKIIQNAFTINPSKIKKDWDDYWKSITNSIKSGLNKPSSFLDNKSKNNIFNELEKSRKTRSKLGIVPELRTFKSSKEISSLIEKARELQKMNLDGSKYDSSMIEEEIIYLQKREEKFIEAESKIHEALAQNYTKQEQLKETIKSQTEELEKLKQQYLELANAPKQTKKIKAEAERVTAEITKLDKELRKSKEDLDNLTKPKGLTKLGKFMNRFKSYLSIRVLRNLFSSIEQQFGESVKNISKFSPELNSTLSSVTSQFTILSNSIATVVVPMLKVVEPILKGITKVASEVASAISFVIAKLSGSATYLKANTEYLKEFNEEMNQFSFDKFESLSGSDNSSNMFIEQDVSDGLTDSMKGVLTVIEGIGAALLAMGTYKFVTWITSGDAKTFFTDAESGLGKIKTKISDISTAGLIASASFAFVTSIVNLIDVIKNWDSQSLITKITAITSAALALAAVVFSILAAIPAIGHTKILKAVAFGLSTAAILTGAISIMKFANGGIAEQGDLFIANEAGPELVYSGPNNSSSIMNIAQFKQAQFEALQAWWDEAKYDLPEGSSFNIDGAQIARSKSFISEINRRNTGLNLK